MFLHRSLKLGIAARRPALGLLSLFILSATGYAERQVDSVSHAQLADGQLHVYVGSVSLPAPRKLLSQ